MGVLSRLTIRMRITGGSLLIAILISIPAGLIIYTQVQHIVSASQSTLLRNIEAPYLTALAESGSEEVDPPGPNQLVAVLDGKDIRRVDTLPTALSQRLPTLLTHAGETRTVTEGGSSYVVRVSDVESQGAVWHVVTASPADAEASVLAQVAVLIIATMASLNLAFGAASWFISTAALSPVSRLRRSARALVGDPTDELLPVGPAQDEISALARTLNELIGQLRASAERERQIVSDASHEFRTPLAIMQTQLELAQAESSSLGQMQSDVAAVQRTLARLSSLAMSMLELSRIDAQTQSGLASGTQLNTELADAADRGRQRVGGREIRVEFVGGLDPAVTVGINEADFGRVCDNLVNNALAAMDDTGLVELALRTDGNRALLTVRDNAGGMSPEFAASAFDRFSRADHARTGGGAGLGLSIVAGVAALAGGSVELDNRPGDGVAVIVAFPLAPDKEMGRPDSL
jgi:signal transduction histidine kinase